MEDKLPTIENYRNYLNVASIRFNLSLNECRNNFGKFTVKQWLNLLKL